MQRCATLIALVDIAWLCPGWVGERLTARCKVRELYRQDANNINPEGICNELHCKVSQQDGEMARGSLLNRWGTDVDYAAEAKESEWAIA